MFISGVSIRTALPSVRWLSVALEGPIRDRFLQPIDPPALLKEYPEFEVVGKREGTRLSPTRQDRFAIVQLGGSQFKLTPDDKIFVERIKELKVNSEIHLKRVMVWASRDETAVGRPYLPGAYVHALVEEQCEDATVTIFKMKRRKRYKRTKYHTQKLTGLRVLSICDLDVIDHNRSREMKGDRTHEHRSQEMTDDGTNKYQSEACARTNEHQSAEMRDGDWSELRSDETPYDTNEVSSDVDAHTNEQRLQIPDASRTNEHRLNIMKAQS